MAQSVGAVALDIVMGKNTVSGVAKQAIQEVQKTFNDGTASIGQKVSAVGQACTQVGASLAPVSAAAQGAIAASAKAAISFETAMAKVKTIAGNASVSYKGNMIDMGDAIKQLSSETGIAAEDVAEATYSAISAGVDTAKSVEFVATANALAVGGFTSMNTSVDVLTSTMNAYGAKAGSAQSISDKLITTQNLGKTTVDELASSMGKVIPTASAYNVSLDNLCATYVSMTKGGIATAEATTYTKSMLTELAKSGSTVGKVLKEETGQSFGQLMASGMSLADVIDILGKSVDGDKEAFAQLWGSTEAGTGALAILNGGTQDFNNTLKEMGNSTGAASDAMDKMNDTSAHKLQVAMNDIKLAAIDLGGAFAPVISDVAEVIGKAAKSFSELSPEAKKTIATILSVVAVASPVLLIFGKLVTTIGSVATAFGGAANSIKHVKEAFTLAKAGMTAFAGQTSALGTAIAGLSAPVLAVVAVVAVLGAAFATLWKNNEAFRQKILGIWGEIKEKLSEAFQKITDAVNSLGFDFQNIKEVISAAWNGLCSMIAPVFIAVFNYISSTVQGFIGVFTGVFEIITGIIKGFKDGDWSLFIQGLKDTFLGWIDIIKAPFQGIFSFFTEVLSGFGVTWQGIWNGISSFLSGIWNGVVSAFQTAWNGISSFLTNVWNGIKLAASVVFTAISVVISTIWNGIKNTITTVVNEIKTVVTVVWNGIKTVITTVMGVIKNVITTYVNFWKNVITTVLNAIKAVVTTVWNSIKSKITAVMSAIKSFITSTWNAIKAKISSVVNAIKSVVTSAFNRIKSTISSVMNSIKATISRIWSAIKSATSSALNGIYSTIKNGFDRAVNYIKGLAKSAYTWGADMIEGIAKGIKDKIGAVSDAVKGVANNIKAKLHFSRPDEGPLREYETWMPDFMDGLAKGINANKNKVVDAVQGMASQMVLPTMTAPVLQNVGASGVNANMGNERTASSDKLYGLLSQLVETMQGTGDITIPVYLGNDLIDERIVRANDRRTLRSGGRA